MSQAASETIDPDAGRIAAIRRFNRFYTGQLGLLQESYLDSSLSLAQMRVFYEIGAAARRGGGITAAEIRDALGMDAGYASRIVARLEKRDLISRAPDPADGRRRLLSLTLQGREEFARWEADSARQVREMLAPLAGEDRAWLAAAMTRAQALLGGGGGEADFKLRAHLPGDIGWVVQRQTQIYAAEHGWNNEYEALSAEIASRFLRDFDPAAERCWIAESDGARLGAVFLMRESKMVARLRLLHVEPEARGCGLGRQLAETCVATAREIGYREIVLWTQSCLHSAGRLYRALGFELVEQAPHHSFGVDLIGQNWRLAL